MSINIYQTATGTIGPWLPVVDRMFVDWTLNPDPVGSHPQRVYVDPRQLVEEDKAHTLQTERARLSAAVLYTRSSARVRSIQGVTGRLSWGIRPGDIICLNNGDKSASWWVCLPPSKVKLAEEVYNDSDLQVTMGRIMSPTNEDQLCPKTH